MKRCYDTFQRPTKTVGVGGVLIGSNGTIPLQSMTNTSTMDTEASVDQICRIAEAGADIVRLTAQGSRESNNLGIIRQKVRERGVNVPLVADIHFNPAAAFVAIGNVEKIRINPGNFVDPGRVFKKIDYTDSEYQSELQKIETKFGEFVDRCAETDTAIRLGVNHGSLSDRIMSRYGDTPAGMVESVMEFLRVAVARNFFNIVISIKASNVVVMVDTVRLLVKVMERENMHFPLHLGVTEAGDGEDGRVKSAVGIGTLLAEGIGDTIRVSLSEAPEAEIPVARMLRDYVAGFYDAPRLGLVEVTRQRRNNVPVVLGFDAKAEYCDDRRPDIFDEIPEFDAASMPETIPEGMIVVTSSHRNFAAAVATAIAGIDNPVIAKACYSGLSAEEISIRASVDLGRLLLNHDIDGIAIETNGAMSREAEANLAFAILQATRRRITRTEYISCPSCGRTLFDLQSTLAAVKKATAGLKGLKIGVMGCVVNGPGEMADADYGYVGAGVGRVSLYRGKECVLKNIPSEEAIPALLELLHADGHL